MIKNFLSYGEGCSFDDETHQPNILNWKYLQNFRPLVGENVFSTNISKQEVCSEELKSSNIIIYAPMVDSFERKCKNYFDTPLFLRIFGLPIKCVKLLEGHYFCHRFSKI